MIYAYKIRKGETKHKQLLNQTSKNGYIFFLLSHFFFSLFKTGSHYVAQADLELRNLSPLPT